MVHTGTPITDPSGKLPSSRWVYPFLAETYPKDGRREIGETGMKGKRTGIKEKKQTPTEKLRKSEKLVGKM